MTTTILETCRVPPPPGEADEPYTLPLTFFDIGWLHYHTIRRLIFYENPCSEAHFLETLLPKLKQSLSLALKHYLPIASNILYPLDTENKPVLHYMPGDSVSLTIAESDDDFDNLIGNHARDADQFYAFLPQLPPVIDEPEYKLIPCAALQVTFFPGRGICIGLNYHHCLGDDCSIAGFMKTWASITKLGGEREFLMEKSESLPIFDRSVINDPYGIGTVFWKILRQIPFKSPSSALPTKRVRATYVFRQDDIKRLKDLVLAKRPGLVHVSSFVVTTSYTWSCLVKSGDAVGEEVDGNAPETLIFAADFRSRISPSVPSNYFGNCLGYGMAKIEHQQLAGDEGFVIAAEAIAKDIKNRLGDTDLVLKGAEKWFSELNKIREGNAFGVFGSPKFDFSEADFGWGRARKLEGLSIDGQKYAMSLSKSSSDPNGGLEVGMSLPKERMEAFASIFAHGLGF